MEWNNFVLHDIRSKSGSKSSSINVQRQKQGMVWKVGRMEGQGQRQLSQAQVTNRAVCKVTHGGS